MMIKRLYNQTGTTITELAVVIVIMLAMIAASIPLFHYLRAQSEMKDFHKQVQEIRAGIAAWHAKKLLYQNQQGFPNALDNQPYPAVCSRCFETILPPGLKNQYWFKASKKDYFFSTSPRNQEQDTYRTSGCFYLEYDENVGQVSIQQL